MTPTYIAQHKTDAAESERWFAGQCRENADQMDADLAEIEALVREKMAAWCEHGWLDRNVSQWVNGARGLNKNIVSRRTPEEMVTHVAACVSEAISNNYSSIATEARDVAGR
jgi:hypothetical protein